MPSFEPLYGAEVPGAYGTLRINRRLFRTTRYSYVANGRSVTLAVGDRAAVGLGCAG